MEHTPDMIDYPRYRKIKGAKTVLPLDQTTSLKLGADTTYVDITIDGLDVYMGFAANPAAATAPYKLKSELLYNLEVHPDDTITLHFAPVAGQFQAGHYARIQEWKGC